MLKATLRQGVIVPLAPVPADWAEGELLEIDNVFSEKPDRAINVEEWSRTMNSLCADSDEGDERVMRESIEQHRENAKARMRHEMGLPTA